jgi:hypothetical protein
LESGDGEGGIVAGTNRAYTHVIDVEDLENGHWFGGVLEGDGFEGRRRFLPPEGERNQDEEWELHVPS